MLQALCWFTHFWPEECGSLKEWQSTMQICCLSEMFRWCFILTWGFVDCTQVSNRTGLFCVAWFSPLCICITLPNHFSVWLKYFQHNFAQKTAQRLWIVTMAVDAENSGTLTWLCFLHWQSLYLGEVVYSMSKHFCHLSYIYLKFNSFHVTRRHSQASKSCNGHSNPEVNPLPVCWDCSIVICFGPVKFRLRTSPWEWVLRSEMPLCNVPFSQRSLRQLTLRFKDSVCIIRFLLKRLYKNK